MRTIMEAVQEVSERIRISPTLPILVYEIARLWEGALELRISPTLSALPLRVYEIARLWGGALEHFNLSSLGALSRYGQYADFRVQENYTAAHAGFLGMKVDLECF